MTDAEGVVGALDAPREARDAVLHAQPRHAFAAPGQHLVGVALVADVPDQAVVGRIEDVVQGHREFHRAEVRRQMAAGARHRSDEESAQLVDQRRQLLAAQLA